MIQVYVAYFRVALLECLQYRFSIFVWLLGRIMHPLIYFSVWQAVLHARGGSVGGMNSHDFAAYYIIISLVNVATSTPFPYRIMEPIQSGRMSNILLKPVNFLHTEIAGSLGSRVVDLLFMIPPMLLFAWAFAPAWNVTMLSIVLVIPATIFAYMVRLFIEGCIGTCSFWAIRTHGFNQAYYLLFFFASGQAAPSRLLPGWVRAISDMLPFRFMIEFPTDILLNRIPLQKMMSGLMLQLLWMIVFGALFGFLWKRGVRKFTAVGI